MSSPGPELPVFVISVAAELSGLHPQTLRSYDRLGLVSPGRTGGGGRRYSWRDIEVLREVATLTANGIGLEGVRRILDLENQVLALRQRVGELEADLEAAELLVARASGVGRPTPNLPVLRRGPTTGQSLTVWRRGRYH